MNIATIALCLAVGAFLYRWRGGPSWLPAPRGLKLALCAAFLNAPAALWMLPAFTLPHAVVLVVCIAATIGTVALGHGAYTNLDRTPPKDKDRVGEYQEEPWFGCLVFGPKVSPDVYRFGLRWLFWNGRLFGSRENYEIVALGVTGLVNVLPAAVAFGAVGNWYGAVALGGAGVLKGLAYWTGWLTHDASRATALGEWYTGATWGVVVGLLVAGRPL